MTPDTVTQEQGTDRQDQVTGPDLRLAGPAAGAWLSALWALYVSPWHAAMLAVAAGLLIGLIWYATRHRGDRTAAVGTVVIGVLIGVMSGAAATAARTSARDAEPIAALVREHTTVRATLVVTDDPRRSRAARTRNWLVDARLVRLRDAAAGNRWLTVDVRVLAIGEDPVWRRVLPGQRAEVTGRLAPPFGGDLRAAILSVSDVELRGPPPLAQRAAGSLRAGLQRAAEPLPDDAGGLLPGLAIGDVSRMDPAVEEDFRATGMTHLTAVSGSNVAIVCSVVLLLTGWCRAGPRTAAALSLAALAGFVILVRPSPSVLRAAVMGALALVALASSRPRAAVPGLAATVYVLVVVDPELAGDAGFTLSVLATAGLLLLAPRWRDALRNRGVPRGVAEAIVVPAAAQVACAPVIAAMTGTVSLSAVPANLLATPAVAPATILGTAAATVSPVWPGGAEFLAWLGGWPAQWLVWVARWGAGLSDGTTAWPGGTSGGLLLAGVLGVLLVLTRHRLVRTLLAVTTVAAVLGATGARTATPGWPPPGWLVVACDVGQGDALVLNVAPGQAIVVDTGPEPTPVDRCLRRLDVTSVPLLVFSHFHADHVGGLAGAIRSRPVGAFVVPRFDEPLGASTTVRQAAQRLGDPLLPVGAGWRYRAGDVRLTALGPDGIEVGTRSDPNNNSLMLKVTLPGFTMLLAGDAEIERQEALLATGEAVRADVLKVAHHGSAYQDPGFLDTVDPSVAIVSVGADNEYGHPNPSVLHRLTVGGARVFRTDQAGDIAVSRTREGLSVTVRGQHAGDHPAGRR
jgi:competence protein ComEC